MVFVILFIFIGIVGGMGFMVMKTLKQTDSAMVGAVADTTNMTSAQEFLPFDNIDNDIIDLGGFKYRMIIECSSINYGLKTGKEKEMIEVAFQRFLNSIQFPITMFVQTKEIDNSKMINSLASDINEIVEEFPQLAEYGQHYYAEMKNLTKTIQNTKQKKKYVIVPFDDASELSQLNKKEKYEHAESELRSRTQIVAEALASIGIKTHILNTSELLELVYSVYHKDDYSNFEHLVSGEHTSLVVEGVYEKQTIKNGKHHSEYVFGNRLQSLSDYQKADFLIYQIQKDIQTEILSKALAEDDDKTFGELLEELQSLRDKMEVLDSQKKNK